MRVRSRSRCDQQTRALRDIHEVMDGITVRDHDAAGFGADEVDGHAART